MPGGAGLGLQNTANNPAWLGSVHFSCQLSELMFINCLNLTLFQETRQQCFLGVCNLIIFLRCLLGRVQTARPGGGPACFPFASGAEQAQSCVRLRQLLFFLCVQQCQGRFYSKVKPVFIDDICYEFLFSVSNVSMGFCQRRRGGGNTLMDTPACSNHFQQG